MFTKTAGIALLIAASVFSVSVDEVLDKMEVNENAQTSKIVGGDFLDSVKKYPHRYR